MVLDACQCTCKIVPAKEQMCTLLITWYSSRKCIKSVLKSLVAKSSLPISVLCISIFLQIIIFKFSWLLPSILVHYANYLRSSANVFDNSNEKQCSKSNHSHKKQKDSLEIQVKLAVLCTYVQNQVILEPIPLYYEWLIVIGRVLFLS